MNTPCLLADGRLDLVGLAAEMLTQPELFDRDVVPIEHEVVAGSRNYCHTGRITCKNEARALTIAAVYLRTESKRTTAKICGCSRYTLDAVMQELEEGGRLAHVRDRLPRLMAQFALEAIEYGREIIESRLITSDRASMLKANGVIAGVGADKVLGPVGDVHVHQHLHVENQRPAAEVAAEWARMVQGSLPAEVVDVDAGTEVVKEA
jgi:hypothetical protein